MHGLVLGFGNMGKLHARIYRELEVEVFVFDIARERIKEAQNLGFKVSKPSKDFDFFDICTPTYTHFELIMKLLEYDKPICVEKPVVLKEEEIAELRRLESKPIFVAETELYNKELKKFFELDSKKIRIERLVDLEYFIGRSSPWFLNPELSGGLILDLLVHDFSILLAKYKEKPEIIEVKAWSEKYRPYDNAEIKLKFDKAQVELFGSWTYKKPIELRIFANDKLFLVYDKYLQNPEPYKNELEEFLRFVETGKLKYSLDLFLDATELALRASKMI